MDGQAILFVMLELVSIAALVATVVCFRKGRRWFGWLGVANFTLGPVLWVVLFFQLRDVPGRFAIMTVAALLIDVVLITGALRSALPGSAWQRRHEAKMLAAAPPPS